MNDMLSILLIVDESAESSDLLKLDKVLHVIKRRSSDFEFVFLLNRGRKNVEGSIAAQLSAIPNCKLIQMAEWADPDGVILEGLQRCIGDWVIIGSLRDLHVWSLEPMLELAMAGHEVVATESRYRGRVYAPERQVYGLRLLSRAAVHYVTHASQSGKGAYHAVIHHDLFNPTKIELVSPRKPKESLFLGIRRRWRSIITSKVAPLRIASTLALFGAGVNIAYSGYVMVIYFLKNAVAPGWVTLSLQSSGMYFLFSLLFFLLCEYMIYMVRPTQPSASVRVVSETRGQHVTFDSENLEKV
jgi:hypothetical protein